MPNGAVEFAMPAFASGEPTISAWMTGAYHSEADLRVSPDFTSALIVSTFAPMPLAELLLALSRDPTCRGSAASAQRPCRPT
jgi:hypothetical protein